MRKMTSREFAVCFLTAILLALVYPGPAKAATQKPVELKFASISAPGHILNVSVHTPWIKQIEDGTQGRCKITLFTGGALGSAKQAYDVAAKGIADISYGWIFYHPGRFPRSEVYTLPGVVPNIKTAYHSWDIYQKDLAPEWTETKLLWLGIAPAYIFIMRDKQIRTISDVKGLKLGCIGSIASKVVSTLGGIPIDVTAQDAYMALQRGVINGYINTWSSTASNKHGEVARYFTNAGLFNSVFYCVMNLDTYKSLPADIRKVIDTNSGQKMFELATKVYWDDDDSAKKIVMQQTGGKGVIYDFPKEELEKYRTIVRPIWDEWVTSLESRGLPGKRVMEDIVAAIEK